MRRRIRPHTTGYYFHAMNTRLVVLTLLWGLIAGHVGAMPVQSGLQEMPLPPIPVAPPSVIIHGKLDEWNGLTGYDYKPLERLVKSGDDSVMTAILADPISINFKACYDTDALYVAVQWHDRNPGANKTAPDDADHWSDGGEGFELHLLTSRKMHLACWPTTQRVAVMARYDDQRRWQDVPKSVAAAGAADGKTFTQELRIPWSIVTASGKLPSDGKVELGVDFAWNAISPSNAENVRKAVELNFDGVPGVSASFLTARPALVSAGYLRNESDWGSLVLGGTISGDQAIAAPDGSTSFTSLSVPRTKKRPATDGSLDGWDPALFQTATLMPALWGNRFSCKLAAQSDADNLYLAAHYFTPGPSNLKSESSQQGFRGGDALQVRLSDGTKKINLCAWYDSGAAKPALTADSKDLSSPFLLQQGATEGFKSDGQGGYVQEMALPWKVLFGSTPRGARRSRERSSSGSPISPTDFRSMPEQHWNSDPRFPSATRCRWTENLRSVFTTRAAGSSGGWCRVSIATRGTTRSRGMGLISMASRSRRGTTCLKASITRRSQPITS